MNFSTSLAIIIFSLFSFISASGIPTSGLRQELVESIKEIQLYGEPKGLDTSVRDLLAQLEQFQMNSPRSVHLDWDVAEASSASEPKNVCIVVSSFEGMYINSGIGTAYYALANLLVSQGHKVTVIYTRDEPTVGGSWDDWVAHHKASGITLLSLPPTTVPLSVSEMQAISLRVYRFLVTLPSFDIVHFADFEGHGFYATLAKKVTNQFAATSFVVGLHGPTRWILEANHARIPVDESEIDIDWMERMAVENADAVWTPSSYMASWMSVQGWTLPSSVHLLPLAPGPEFLDFVAPVSNTVQPTEFVYFGRLEVRKGLVLFCDALDLFAKIYHTLDKEITITFLGRSGLVNGIEGTEYVLQRAGKWPFTVRMNNNASRKQALSYLSDSTASRVAIVPSLSDNAPYTIFECLYAGIPFLASNVPSISPLIADDDSRAAHLFEVKPHHIVSKMAAAIRNGISSASPAFTIKQAESVWTSFYAKVQPKTPVVFSEDAPLVSVVITHYNRADLVQQAIASIESQTYSEIEVVLVDDGSTEESALRYLNSIESSFQEKNWQIIRSSNKYLGAARNAGAKAANGKYLLFLDDDNVFVPTAVDTYVQAAKLTGAGILTAGHAIFQGGSYPSSDVVTRQWVPLGASLTAGLFKNTFGDANFFVEKSKFDLVGGFTEDKNVGLEEHEFFAQSVFSGVDLQVVPEILLYYRQHNQKNQMLYNTDVRLGEARRLRPYISALGEQNSQKSEEETHQSSRRSLVNLVARNAVAPRAAVCNVTMSAIAPTEGLFVGGTTVIITGVGFTCGNGPSAVTIDSVACTTSEVLNDTAIACVTPRSVRTEVYVQVDVSVTISSVVYTLRSAYRYLPTPAPTLLGANLDDSGALTVTFSVPTNGGVRARSAALCSALFDQASQAALGSSTDCTFQTESSLVIGLGSDATVATGDTLIIPEGAINGAGPNGAPNAKIVITVTTTSSPIKPTVIINPSPLVGKCDGITLNATSSMGSGGRRFTKVVWSLNTTDAATEESVSAIVAALSAASSARSLLVVLPAHIVVADASYKFVLTLTNWFAVSDSSNIIVKKSFAPVPIVSINGDGVRNIYKDTDLSFTGVYSGLACNETYGPAKLLWSITPSPAGVVGSTTTSFMIPANTLIPGQTYTVTFTVTDVDSGEKNNATVQVIVGARPLVAQIIGGGRQFGTTENVTLSASNSSDPDNIAPLTFSWSCVVKATSAPCPNIFTTDATQMFLGSSLGVGVYTITVTVAGALARTASASTDVTITQLPYLKIHIDQTYSTYAVADQITLYGKIDATNIGVSDIKWSWTTTSTVLGTAYTQGTTSMNLVIAGGSLRAGTSYTYTLTATDSTSGITGVATVTFNIIQSLPPVATVCADTRGAPSTYSTSFYFSFGDRWQYASGVNTFQIFYEFAGSKINYPVVAAGSAYNMTTRLPAGNLNILGKVVASTGVESTFTCSVVVAGGDINAIGRDALNATSVYDFARAAFSIYNSKTSTTVETDVFAARTNVLTRALYIEAESDTLSAETIQLISGVLETLANIINGQMNTQEIIGSGAISYSIFTTIQSSGQSAKQLSSLSAVQNTFGFLDTQIDNASGGANRARAIVPQSAAATQYDSSELAYALRSATSKQTDNPWAGISSLAEAKSASVASQSAVSKALISALPLGIITTLFSSFDIKTYYKDSPAVIDGNGASLGVNSTIMISSGTVPTSVLGQSAATVLYVESRRSPYVLPEGFLLASAVMSVRATDSSNADFNLSTSSVVVVIPDSVLNTNNGSNACAMYTDGKWTEDGVNTDRSTSNSTVCTFPKFATFALLNKPSGSGVISPILTTSGNNASSEDGGISGGAIAGIVIGAVALVAIVAAGSAYGVKKHRDNAAIATGRPSPRSGDSGFGGIAIDPPLDPIFIPAHLGPQYVPPANGTMGPTYIGAASPVIYGTFQQPAMEQPIAGVPPGQRRGQPQTRENDFSSDSESSDGY